MNNSIVIITGSNSGIGKAAANKFASEGHQVIMACRKSEKSRLAWEEVKSASGNSTIELMELDVSSFASIRRFCSEFKEKYSKLDILIHNAGYFKHGIKKYQLSADNIELTFATNAFGPLLMTELLREHLAISGNPKVLNAGTSNIKHFFDPKRHIEFDNLRGEYKDSRRYSVYKMYGDSKMGLFLLTQMMAKRYKAEGIRVNFLMITAVKVSKDTLSNFSLFYRIIGKILQNINPYSLSPAHMANNYYRICTSDEFAQVTGALISSELNIIPPLKDNMPVKGFRVISELWNTKHIPAYGTDPANIEKMWELSTQVTGLTSKEGYRLH
ncbi:MAG: SDR family NAD(P)-dependent oxidoreductase [Balneolales bacterium]